MELYIEIIFAGDSASFPKTHSMSSEEGDTTVELPLQTSGILWFYQHTPVVSCSRCEFMATTILSSHLSPKRAPKPWKIGFAFDWILVAAESVELCILAFMPWFSVLPNMCSGMIMSSGWNLEWSSFVNSSSTRAYSSWGASWICKRWLYRAASVRFRSSTQTSHFSFPLFHSRLWWLVSRWCLPQTRVFFFICFPTSPVSSLLCPSLPFVPPSLSLALSLSLCAYLNLLMLLSWSYL